MSVKKYIFFTLIFSAVIALTGYWYFGGFTPRQQELVEVKGYHLIGRHFKGKLNNPDLENIFFEVRQKHANGDFPGLLTLVTIKEPRTGSDTLEQFIGILCTPEFIKKAELPGGWDTYTLDSRAAVRNTIRAHNLAMPKPEEVRKEIFDFAEARQLSLNGDISIEKYLGERHLEVEIPVLE